MVACELFLITTEDIKLVMERQVLLTSFWTERYRIGMDIW